MNMNDNPDSTAPLPSAQSGDFETYVREVLGTIVTRLANVELGINQLSGDVSQLSRDQHDRYVDLRLRLSTWTRRLTRISVRF